MPAPVEKRNGRFRYQLCWYANERSLLHESLNGLEIALSNEPLAKRIRWSLDIDPLLLD